MSEYLKKPDLLKKCYCHDTNCVDYCANHMFCDKFGLSYYEIEYMETEDVTPVVHAKWIEHEHEWGRNYENSDYECSHCHNIISMFYDTDWCPNCGVRMDL